MRFIYTIISYIEYMYHFFHSFRYNEKVMQCTIPSHDFDWSIQIN